MALLRRSIRRDRHGGYSVRLPQAERAVLRSVATQLGELLVEADDPGLVRLFPTAYPDDPARDEQYREMVRDDLVERRRAQAEVLRTTADADHLDEEQLLAWLGVINDVRLVVGTRLDVSEDDDRDLDPDDPDTPAYALYQYLGWLVEQIVDELRG